MGTGRLSLVEPRETVSLKEIDINTKEGPMSTDVQCKTRVWNSEQSRLERPVKESRNQKGSHMQIS